MKSRALFTLFLVGAAGTATAQDKQEETSGRVSLNEKAPESQPPRSPDDWVELASATPAKHGTEYIVVGKDQGEFARLRLDAVRGVVPVKAVRIELTDGTTKTYRVQRRIDAKHQTQVYIDLPTTGQLSSVVVMTDRRSTGAYTVHASGSGGIVARR